MIHREVMKGVMKKEEFCIVALVNRAKGGDDAIGIDMASFAFGVVKSIISFLISSVLWTYRANKLKKEIKNEILKELSK